MSHTQPTTLKGETMATATEKFDTEEAAETRSNQLWANGKYDGRPITTTSVEDCTSAWHKANGKYDDCFCLEITTA